MRRNIDIREDELEMIGHDWPMIPLNMTGYIDRWDGMGRMMGTSDIPVDDTFLDLIDRIGRPSEGKTVMEIGCGSGDHCFALSGKVDSVLGLDISQVIVDNCRRKCIEKDIPNVTFRRTDWFTVPTDDPLVVDGADIVIAHYSPAVYSYGSFRKMVEAAKGSGFVCLELNWSDPVYREAYRIAGIRTQGSCEYPLRMIDTLWHLGYSPHAEYVDRETVQAMDPETAADEMIMHMSIFGDYDRNLDGDIREAVMSMEADGKVEFRDRWTDVHIHWEA